MSKKSRYITDFVISDGYWESRRKGQWGICDLDRKGEMAARRWTKNLKAAVAAAGKIKNPAFFSAAPVGACVYVPVTLYHKDKSITTLAVPDSGATISVFNAELAGHLGIDLKKCRKVESFAVGPWSFSAYETVISLRVGRDSHFIETPVHFLSRKYFAALLGQAGFFEHFEVVFDPRFVLKYRFVK